MRIKKKNDMNDAKLEKWQKKKPWLQTRSVLPHFSYLIPKAHCNNTHGHLMATWPAAKKCDLLSCDKHDENKAKRRNL